MLWDKINAVGSFDGGSPSSTVVKYYQDKDKWTCVKSMPTARLSAGVGVINDKIYLVGGYGKDGICKVVECYDVHTDSWSVLSDMNVGRQ